MSEVEPSVTPRQVAWQRRRHSARATWAEFRRHPSGLFGLAVLVLFGSVALFSWLFGDVEQALRSTAATGEVLDAPSGEYWLGTDQNGRSVLTLLVYGAQVSLFVGLLATVISMVVGTLVGLASGHFGGWIGTVLYRVTEWFLVIPFLPTALVLASVLGSSMMTIAFVIGITSWPGTALLIRSQTLTIEARPYMERARALGSGHWRQMNRHVLPNVMPMVFANTTLTVAIAILTETTLSFLGLGDPTRVSWGSMLDDAFTVGAITTGAWWFIVPPGICVILVVLSFTLIGQALEEVFNPRLRER